MISEPFAKVLAASRAQFNERVLEARRRYPDMDLDSFAALLRTGGDGVVRAAAAAAPESVASVAPVVFELALELAGLGLAGASARSGELERVWRELAPEYALLIGRHPSEVLARLMNAAIYLESMPSVRLNQWIEEMALMAPEVHSLQQLEAAGQIVAWRAGAAHFRHGAILAADQLPEPLALTALGVGASESWGSLRQCVLANPWWKAAGEAVPFIEVGAFTGFGGEFSVPPEVRPCPDGFIVKSSERYYLLVADAYGTALHSATNEEFQQAEGIRLSEAVHVENGVLRIGNRKFPLDLPDEVTVCCNSHTVALTSPYTHAIRLFPLQ